MFGEWTMLIAFLYVIGLLLLVVEAIAPGFGVAGGAGIVCVVASIIMLSKSIYGAMLLIIGTAAIVTLLGILLFKLGLGKKYLKYFVLGTEQKNEEGYTSTKNYKNYIGMQGIVVTPLRSSGTVIIDEQRLDAVSQGEFIEKGASIEVIAVEGRRIIVKEIKE